MAIRRPKLLTTLLTSVDRRLYSVERRYAPRRLSVGALKIATTTVDPGAGGSNTGGSGAGTPAVFSRIISKQYIPTHLNPYDNNKSPTDWIILKTDAPHGLSIGDKITVESATGPLISGVRRTIKTIPTYTSLTYTSEGQYYSYRGAGVPVDNDLSVNVVNKSCTTTTATLVTDVPHNYRVDDYVEVNGVSATGEPYDGVFKVAKITGIPNVTDGYGITYDFITPQTARVGGATTGGKLWPVLAKAYNVGDTWVDTSVTPVVTYYWTGLRWLDYNALPANAVVNDGVPPKAPGIPALSSTGYTEYARKKAKIVVTWTAPTANVDNSSPVTDLLSYLVEWKYDSDTAYRQAATLNSNVLTYTINDLVPGKNVTVAVSAKDSGGNTSQRATNTITTGTSAISLAAPSAPVLTSRLGTVTVKWNGLDANGDVPPEDFNYLTAHCSKTQGFTPSADNLVGYVRGVSDFCVATDLDYNVTYYFKFISYDTSVPPVGTDPGAESSIMVKPLVDTDLIANTLNTWPFAGQVVKASALEDGSVSGLKLAQNAITKQNITNIMEAGAIVSDVIAANAIGANQIAAGSIVAGKLAANSVTAGTISALAIKAGDIDADAITADKIQAGAVSAIKILANTITGDKVSATTSLSFVNSSSTAVIGYGAVPGQAGYATGLSISGNGFIGDVSMYNSGAGLQLASRNSGNGVFVTDTNLNLTNISVSYMQLYSAGGISLQSDRGNTYIYQSGSLYVASGSAGADPYLTVATNGNTLIRAANTVPTNPSLTVYGNIRASGNITANVSLSSKRFKTDIREFDSYDSVLSITPKLFKYDNAKRYESWDQPPNGPAFSEDILGAMAEDFIDAGLSYLVTFDDQGRPETLDYSRIAVLLIPILRDLKIDVDYLKKEINK